MATHKATLGKTVDGVVEYIYPKSTSDIIEYTETQSVKEKLDELDEKQGVAYGTCSTAASTAAKVVSCDGFVLETGATIIVSFDNANSASSPTMNVNSTGAKSIYAYGTTAPSTSSWRAGGMMAFTYDGTGWVMQDFSTANTSYYGVTKLSDSVSSTSTTLAGTANAVKTAYDAATAAQDAADAAQTAADAAMSYAEANTYTHPTVTASNTTSTATATYGGTFTAIDSVTRDSCGHVTGVNTKTVTMPAASTTADQLGTATVGSGTNPIYLSSGSPTASTSTVGSGTKPIYLSSGTMTASTSSVGNATTPVYLSSGTITACSGITASTADSATTAETAEKLGSATVGSSTKPIYLSSGTATASSSTVGSGVIPMYLSSGTMTASTSTVGSGTKPIYLSSGTLTVSSSTVGSGTVPMYLSSGTLTASTSSVGSAIKPIYLNSGTLTASATTVGSATTPVYLSSGTITACSGITASSADTATTAEKLGTTTVGSGTKPIYLSSGTATASTSTVGSSSTPVYLSSGTITACSSISASTLGSSTVGSGTKPIYLSSGTATASSSTVGSGVIPMYLSSGTMTASTSTVGSGTKPMYLSSGTLTASSSTVGSSSAPVYLSSGTITACTGVATSSELSSLSSTVSELSDETSRCATIITSLPGCNGYYKSGSLGNVTADNIDDFIKSYGLGSETRKDVYIGCFFTADIGTANRRLYIASFDHDYSPTYGSQGKHHTVIIPSSYLYGSVPMNETDTTEGGYYNSNVHQNIIPIVDGYLKDVFGDHLIQYYDNLSTTVDASASNYNRYGSHGIVTDSTLVYFYSVIMSEIETFGRHIFSANNGEHTQFITPEHQLPIFQFRPDLLRPNSDNYWWLRDIASDASVVHVTPRGSISFTAASGNSVIRPRFSIG